MAELLDIAVQVVRPYEAVILMHPDASDDDQKALFRRNKSIIEAGSGQVNHVDTWGKRRLSNPIERMPRALYFHTTFTATPSTIAELERTMRINDKVLRFMHTRLDERLDITKHLEAYRNVIEESGKREREREAKFQAKKAARKQRDQRGEGRDFRDRDRGDRGDRGDQRDQRDQAPRRPREEG